ncbi:MAG: hypothetical protein J7L78_02885 [Dehalococcoidales bacterium]|nr:hypothetical protein [Dehalococcoidales bacterium]
MPKSEDSSSILKLNLAGYNRAMAESEMLKHKEKVIGILGGMGPEATEAVIREAR